LHLLFPLLLLLLVLFDTIEDDRMNFFLFERFEWQENFKGLSNRYFGLTASPDFLQASVHLKKLLEP